MINKVMQTIISKNGNCFPACLATVLGLKLEDIPNFAMASKGDRTKYWELVKDYLTTIGYKHTLVPFRRVKGTPQLNGLVIVIGSAPTGSTHSVVYRDGSLFHDPHPNGNGVMPDQAVILEISKRDLSPRNPNGALILGAKAKEEAELAELELATAPDKVDASTDVEVSPTVDDKPVATTEDLNDEDSKN